MLGHRSKLWPSPQKNKIDIYIFAVFAHPLLDSCMGLMWRKLPREEETRQSLDLSTALPWPETTVSVLPNLSSTTMASPQGPEEPKQHQPPTSTSTSHPPTSVRVGVGVFTFRSPTTPHFLLGKRNNVNSMGTNTFALAGGHLETGETFEECAAREVREECGLEVRDLRFVTAVNSLFLREGGDGGVGKVGGGWEGQGGESEGKAVVVEGHYVTVFMSCVVDESATRVARGLPEGNGGMNGAGLVEPENLEPHKCEGWEWTSFAEMRAMEQRRGVKLFLPLNVLMQERPDACTLLENWG